MTAHTASAVWDFLNREDVSTAEFAAIAIGGLIAVVLLFFGIKKCVAFTKETGVSAHSLIKIALFAAGPLFMSILAIFRINLPLAIPIVIAVIAGIIILIWNITTLGIGYGILFTILHLLGGFFVGLGIGGLILMVVFGIAVYLFTGGKILPGDSSGGTASGYVYDLQTNERFHVSALNGVQQIQRGGDWVIIRPGAYAGEYIDDYGNRYADSDN